MLGLAPRKVFSPASPFTAHRAAPSGGTITISLAQLLGMASDHAIPASNFNALEQKYGESGLVYACVSTKATDTARAPLRAMRRGKGKDNRPTLTPLPSTHPLEMLLQKVSDLGATQEWLVQMTSMYLDLLGNAFWLIVWAGRRQQVPLELYPINPLAVTIYPSHYEVWHYDRPLKFRRWGPGQVGDLLHFRLPNPRSQLSSMFPSEWGLGPLEAGWTLVVTDIDAVKWNRSLVKNDGRPTGLLTSEQDISPQDAQAAATLYKQMFGGPEGAGKILVQGKGLKYERVSMTPAELDYSNSRTSLREDIMVLLGTNAARLGYAQGDVGRREEQLRTYWQGTIVSRSKVQILPPMNEYLAPAFGGDIVIAQDFSEIAELQEDLESRMRVAKEAWLMGCPFEVANERLDMRFPKFDGSDRSYLPFSVAPAESIDDLTAAAIATPDLDDDDPVERAIQKTSRAIARIVAPAEPPAVVAATPRTASRKFDVERDPNGLITSLRETVEE